MIKNYLIMLIVLGNMTYQLHADKAYVGNVTSHTVSIFNTTNNVVTGLVKDDLNTIKEPAFIAFTPDGQTAYVTNDPLVVSDPSTISIINVPTDTVTGIVTNNVGSATTFLSLAITPDGTKMYVAAYDSVPPAVYIADLTTNIMNTTVITPVPLPFNKPSYIAITPDGTKAYVTNQGDDSVSVIQVSNDTVTQKITGGLSSPWALSISPDGKTVYVANRSGLNVTIIDVATDTVTGNITAPSINNPTDLAISPNGTSLYILNFEGASSNQGDITVVDLTNNNAVLKLISGSAADGSDFFAFASNGNKLYLTNQSVDSVSIINAISNIISDTVSDPGDTFQAPVPIAMVPALAQAPSAANGLQVANIFLTQTEFVNALSWMASSGSPVSYAIYRNADLTDLAGTVSGNTLTFQDHDQSNSSTMYYIVAVDKYDAVSRPIVVTVGAV